jgi:hypothetical protein
VDKLDSEYPSIWHIFGSSQWSPKENISLQERGQTRRPLSPMLFVLVADLLQSIINKAKHLNMIRLPLPNRCGQDFHIVQYADDTLLIMEACPKQLFFLKGILNTFAASTGLRVNYNKSSIYPINVNSEKLEILSRMFNCQTESMPFTYLGLPLGLSKPRLQHFLPQIHRIERRLTYSSKLLSQAGRLELVNSVFSALPTCWGLVLKCYELRTRQHRKKLLVNVLHPLKHYFP